MLTRVFRKTPFLLLTWILLPVLAAAGRPGLLRSLDPLSAPPPAVELEGRWAPDGRAPAEKITPRLQLIAAEVPMGTSLKVIVLLVEPGGRPASSQLVQAVDDALNRRLVAALEHRFVGEAARCGFRATRGLENIPVVVGEIPSEMLDELAAIPMVHSVEPDLKLHALRQEGGAMIRSPELQAAGGDGNGIGVAILDTGIDWTHPELPWGDAVMGRADLTGTQPEDYGGFDDGGHGTACAGIVAGRAGGMAPKAHLWTLKVLDSSGSGDFSYTVAALDMAYSNRNNFGGLNVVSMSLGGSAPIGSVCDTGMPSMTAAMQKLVSAGVVIFVASGNDGCSDGISFPACVSHAISVGAVYDANIGGVAFGKGNCTPSGCQDSSTAAYKITCYSNSGENLDLLGPSHDCNTTKMGGGYEPDFGGTSAATPYVAGLAAQILSLRPATTPAELRSALGSTGRAVTDARNGITRRVVDGQAAYQALTGGGGGGSDMYWLPVVIHKPGVAGAQWRTDVAILNMGSTAINPELTLRTPTNTHTSSLQQAIAPGAQAMIVDILGQMGISDYGSLSIATDEPVILGSRTYSQSVEGTTGQFLDGLTMSDGLSAGQWAIVAQLIQGWHRRSNLGLVNMGSSTASGSIELYDSTGRLVGSFPFSIAAGKYHQEDQPFKKRYGKEVYGGYAKVVVTSGSGVFAYGSVIDNDTNDATTVPMKK